MRSMSIEDTELTVYDLPHARSSFQNFLGRAGVLADGPQAYLVHMPDHGSFVPPHFHDIDQFQIAVFGDGKFGKRTFKPGVFAYADAYGPYGPIRAGEKGVSFLTLRVSASSGQYDMPGSRHLMPGNPGKSMFGAFDTEAPLPDEGHPAVREVLAEREDGVLVEGMRIAPNGQEPGVPSEGGGQYYVVCAGSLFDGEKNLPVSSLVYVEPGEDAPVLRAGADGAVVVMMQFPRPSDRTGSDPAQLRTRDYSTPYAIAP